ncbi:MAG: hypothetical protein ACYTGA_14305, partial [Planctomycetota bacterium]
ADGDYFDIISIVKATDDNNKIYGGTLDYEGDKTPYESGDTYYYIADPTLPGYVGEDDFDVQLWDGEYLYSDFDDQGNYTKEAQYGSGTIDLTIDNTLPEAGGDLGDNHMNNVVDGIDLFDFTSDADNDPLEIVDLTQVLISDHWSKSEIPGLTHRPMAMSMVTRLISRFGMVKIAIQILMIRETIP